MVSRAPMVPTSRHPSLVTRIPARGAAIGRMVFQHGIELSYLIHLYNSAGSVGCFKRIPTNLIVCGHYQIVGKKKLC